ncbi:MAG: cadherin-like beta sandwich domain-containing protein [bacterium]
MVGTITGTSFDGNLQVASSFTTGDAAHGYDLQDVRIEFIASTGDPGDIVVALHASASGGGPADEPLDTLSGDNPVAFGTHTYTASEVSLAAGTEYFIVLSAPDAPTDSNNFYNATVIPMTGETGDSGWSIGDQSYFNRNEAGFEQDATPFILSFAVIADVNPPPPPTLSIAATGAPFTEGDDASATFTVSSDPAPTDDLEVVVTLTGADTFVAESERTQTITIAADATSATASFAIANDETDEAAATATATIGDSAAYLGDGATAMAAINDDDEPTAAASDDATLNALSLSGVTLAPGFTSGNMSYTASVTNDVDSTTITATATDSANATIAYNTPQDTDGNTNDADVELVEGENTITITVTAADGTTNAYTITVTRAAASASTDATLSELSLAGVTLAPTFTASTTSYTANVGDDASSTTITATATDTTGATIAYNTPQDTDGNTDDAAVNLIEGENTITITVTAEDGTTNAYTITVCRDSGGGGCGISQAAERAAAEVVPVFAAAIASNVADAISSRIDAVNAGGGNNNLNAASLTASFATQGVTAMASGAEFESVIGDGVKRFLDGKTHSLALSGDGGVNSGAGVWLGGSYQSLGGEDDALDWDGDLYSIQLGADARLSNRTLAGAAMSRSEGEWDYETVDVDDDSGKPIEGTIELSTTSVHPYFAWRRAGGMDIWASVGYGEGDLENRETTNGGAQASGDVELRSASLGIASGDLAVDDASTMRLKFDAQVANTEVDYDDAMIDDLDVASRRVRVGMEFGGGGGNTRRAFELGARYDGGDARSGVGIEVGGHLAHDNGDGMSASLNARALLAHGGEHDEWGISGTLRYASGADGQGLSWRVEPGWGVTQSGVDRLWTESAAELAADDSSNESFDPIARMDGEIAHGFAFGEGMLTPYTGLRLSDGAHDYRFGGRYKLIALPLEMSAEAYRKQRDANGENGVVFKAGMSW